MRKRLAALLLSAVVISGLVVFAQAPSPTPSTMLRTRGTVERYEASTRTLTLATADGSVQFPLVSTTRVRRDGETMDAAELAKLSGYRAAVRYTDAAGRKTVESIHVFSKSKG